MQLPTMEKILEIDGTFIENNNKITQKISEIGAAIGAIGGILEKSGSGIKELRETCCSVMKKLEKEMEEKRELEENIDSQKQEYKKLKDEKERLEGEWIEESKKQRKNIEKIQTDYQKYQKYYENERNKREQEESKLRSLKDELVSERSENQKKSDEVETLKNDLDGKKGQISELKEKVDQFQSKERKMPALMRLYDAYNEVMEKKEGLPKAFTDHWQRVVPMDDFDSFLEKVFKRLFPINYYQSIQAFIARCDQSGEISDEDKKKALRVSDGLLSEIFVFGSKYFGEEKLFWMDDIKAGDKFDSGLCIYIDRKGTMFGNIAEVLLHGIRDEKNNKIYHSYVEGE